MPYSIRLPDGRIIANIPDNVNPKDAAERIRAAGLVGAVEEPEDERSTTEMLGAAFMRGAKQTGSLLGDVLPAQIATAVGADEYAARQMEEAAQTQREIQEKYPARYPTLEAVKGPGDYLPFAGEVIAENVANLATAIVPGAGGAALAGRAAAGAALKRGLTAEAAAAAGASAAGKGAAGGAFLGSYALNSPEIFQNIYEETGELAPGAAALAGSVSAALDSILPAAIVNRLSPGAKSTIVERILERSGMSPGIARGAVAGVIGGVAVEGPTEAGQEAISIAAEKFVADNDAVWGSKEFNRLVESGVRGAIGGGGISGAIGAVKGIGERAPERAPEIQDPTLAAAAERVRALQPEEDMGEVVDEAKPTVPPTVGAGATRAGVEPAAVEPSVPVSERGAEAVPPRAAALETGRLAEPVPPVSEPRVGEEVQPSALETAAPVGFKTSKGSLYALDETGRTSRTKKSPGKGQGKTYPPHLAFYVKPEDADSIRDDKIGGNASIRLGYDRDGKFQKISDISELPAGTQPLVAVVDKDKNTLRGFYPAKTNPEVGLSPIEKLYNDDGTANTHVGNPIVELFSAPAATPEAAPTPAPTPTPEKSSLTALEIEREFRQRMSAGEFSQIQPPQSLIDLTKQVREADAKANYPAAKAAATKLSRRLNRELEAFARQVLGKDPSYNDIGNLNLRINQFIDPELAEYITAPQQQEIPGVSEPFSLRNLLDQSDEKQLAKYDEILEPPKKKEKVFAESTPVLKELQNTSQRLADFIASRGFDPNNLASVRRAPEDVSDAIKILGNLRAGANNIVTSIRSQEYKYATATDKEAAKAIPKTGLLNTLSRVQSDIKTARSFLDDPSSGTGQLVFSTIRQADPDVQGMKAASVQDVVEEITRGYANLPAMRAVQNVSELPADIQAQIKNEGAVPKGMYDTKTATVYFVGNNLAGPTDTILTAIHEIIGHFGLRAILGADYQRVMNEIYNGNASIREKANKKLRETDKLPLEIATEEVLAEMAETKLAEYEAGKKTGISGALRRIIDAIKRFASKIGRPLKDVTDKDVLELLSNSRKFVQGERLGYDRFTEGVAADKPLEAQIDKNYRTVYSKANQELDDAMSQFQTPAGPVRIDPTNARKSIKADAESRMRYDQAKGLFGIKKLASYGPAVRQAMLKIMTLRMINDAAGKKVPEVGNAVRTTENLISMRNNIMKEAQEKVTNKLLDVLKRKNGTDQIQLMGEVAIQATILSVDPDPNGKFHSPNKTLSDAWNLLDDDVKEIYREMRDFYERQIDGTVNDMVERINNNVADPTKRSRLIKELLDEVGPSKRKGPYFPLRRFGNYWFQVGTGDTKEFYMFESAFDRDFWMKERQAELDAANRSDLEIVSGDQIRGAADSLHSAVATESLFTKIDSIIDGATTDGKNASRLKDELKDSVRQLNYLMLPTTNMRKMFVHRKGIPGASTDITRVFSSSAVNIAYQRARTKYADPFYQNIDRGFASLEKDTTPESRVQNDILIELENRTSHILGIEPTTGAQRLANYATQASFLWLLTAPASAILNVVGTITVGMPYIAARYGYGPAMGKMFDYFRKYVATAPTMKEGVTVAPTLEKSTNLTPLQSAAYARLSHDNAIDASLTYDVMGLADRPLEKRGLLANRFVEGISALFHHSERMNREVMTMTIFDFAYDKFKKEGKLSDAEAFESAIQEAKDLTTMSLGDFTRATRAPIFTGPVAKVLFQFKQYSLLMTYNILRNTQLGFNPFRKNLTDDEKAMAIEARRRMYGVLGMTALFAGLKGMPIFSAVGAMVEAMSGDDEDEIVDFEYWLDGYLRDTFGGTAAAAIMRGLIPQVTGAALSERASLDLADLWLRDSGYQKTAEDTIKEQILSLLGPTVSIGLGAAKGWDTMQNGQFERGLESMMPTVARNLLVVKRYFEEEGATTKRGVMIKEDITPAEYISQALGFTPEDVMQRQKATIRRKSAESAIEAQRERLLNRLFFAVWADDDSNVDAALAKIDEYNDKYPELPIDQETIQTSIANRSKSIAEQEAFGGVNKKLADRLGEQFRQPE